MVVASTEPSTSNWNLLVLPPQMLIGQVNPVVLSVPEMSCQAPVPKKLFGALRAVPGSKPDLNKSVAGCGEASLPVDNETLSNLASVKVVISPTFPAPSSLCVILLKTVIPLTFTVVLNPLRITSTSNHTRGSPPL